jgi:trehalose-6-phosphatase
MSVEIRPLAADKGTVVRALAERLALRGLVVAGDDLTDLDMFEAAGRLAVERGLRVARIVVAGGGEVPSAVPEAGDALLESPAAFAALLRALA